MLQRSRSLLQAASMIYLFPVHIQAFLSLPVIRPGVTADKRPLLHLMGLSPPASHLQLARCHHLPSPDNQQQTESSTVFSELWGMPLRIPKLSPMQFLCPHNPDHLSVCSDFLGTSDHLGHKFGYLKVAPVPSAQLCHFLSSLWQSVV